MRYGARQPDRTAPGAGRDGDGVAPVAAPAILHHDARRPHSAAHGLQGEEGMGNIIAGVVLIGIGLAIGESIFLGQVTVLSVFFDGLGLFWLGKGVLGMVRARQAG
jgi:hypothetical protein